MSRSEAAGRVIRVRIEISVDTFDPPEGVLVADDGEAIRFAGWLDLLRVLSELLEPKPA
jgi:hypothetical protein